MIYNTPMSFESFLFGFFSGAIVVTIFSIIAGMFRKRTLRLARLEMAQAFEEVSGQVLSQNTQDFLLLARETLGSQLFEAKGEMKLQSQNIEAIEKSIFRSVQAVDQKLGMLEKEQRDVLGGLRSQIEGVIRVSEDLGRQTTDLASSLKNNAVRGRWGEAQLKRVVEMAGMQQYCDFDTQCSSRDGSARPDMVILLPDQRRILVDAKVPLGEIDRLSRANSEAERKRIHAGFLSAVKVHIRALSKRAYSDKFEDSAEYVVMFLPAESFFYMAVQADPDLLFYAEKHGVMIATPFSLIALLKTISSGWRESNVNSRAIELCQLVRQLRARVDIFLSLFNQVGVQLDKASKMYRNAERSFSSRLQVTLDKMERIEMGEIEEIREGSSERQSLRLQP